MSKGPRPRPQTIAAVAFGLILVVAARSPADLRPTPPFSGPSLPEPPQQKQPWTPPATGLPKFLVAATATLAEQGLADPRGCEYREVEFEGQNKQFFMEGEARVMHAWVLPAQAEEGPRFAIAWNGLIYPLVKLGDPVDPAADDPHRFPRVPRGPSKAGLGGPNQILPCDESSPIGLACRQRADPGLPAAPPRPGRPRRAVLRRVDRLDAAGLAEGPDLVRRLLPDPRGRLGLGDVRKGCQRARPT